MLGVPETGFDPRVRKIPWRRADNPLQYPGLENAMERGPWWATLHGVTESDMTEQLSTAQHNSLLDILSKNNVLKR